MALPYFSLSLPPGLPQSCFAEVCLYIVMPSPLVARSHVISHSFLVRYQTKQLLQAKSVAIAIRELGLWLRLILLLHLLLSSYVILPVSSLLCSCLCSCMCHSLSLGLSLSLRLSLRLCQKCCISSRLISFSGRSSFRCSSCFLGLDGLSEDCLLRVDVNECELVQVSKAARPPSIHDLHPAFVPLSWLERRFRGLRSF